MRPDSRTFGLANGYSPIAKNVICVDFDGTLYPFGELFSYANPMPGAVQAMKDMKSNGFTLVIFTSRLSPRWLESEGHDEQKQRDYIAELLYRDGIPYDGMTAEKIPAIAYVDDRAVEYAGRPFEWQAIADDLHMKYAPKVAP